MVRQGFWDHLVNLRQMQNCQLPKELGSSAVSSGLLGVAVLGHGVVKLLQRGAVLGEIAALLRRTHAVEGRVDILQGSRFRGRQRERHAR